MNEPYYVLRSRVYPDRFVCEDDWAGRRGRTTFVTAESARNHAAEFRLQAAVIRVTRRSVIATLKSQIAEHNARVAAADDMGLGPPYKDEQLALDIRALADELATLLSRKQNPRDQTIPPATCPSCSETSRLREELLDAAHNTVGPTIKDLDNSDIPSQGTRMHFTVTLDGTIHPIEDEDTLSYELVFPTLEEATPVALKMIEERIVDYQFGILRLTGLRDRYRAR